MVTHKTNKINSLQYFNFQHCYIFRASMFLHQGVSFYTTIARPSYHLQYTKMWWDHWCMTYSGELMISTQFRILDIIKRVRSSDWFVKLHSLMIDQWAPTYVRVL
jgi:hypothetical protein